MEPELQQSHSPEQLKELNRSVAVNIYKNVAHKKKEHDPSNVLANFLVGRWILWVIAYVKYRFGFKHRFLSYHNLKDNGIYKLNSATGQKKVKLALAADWGTDTLESKQIGLQMGQHQADYTIHLGDTYFVGDRKEIKNNFKPGNSFWPYGKVGSFALPGNHEMYSNGYGYFEELLPWMGLFRPQKTRQIASYFCLENEYWQIIGLDTGYRSVGIPILELLFSKADLRPEINKWFKEVLNLQNSNKGIILLTHHQYTSAFDKHYPAAGRQIAEFLDQKKVLWFWGHEHRLAFYGQYKAERGITAYGRCIGHGGMPISLVNINALKPGSNPVLVDNRPNKEVAGKPVGHNGYAIMELEDQQLQISYYDEENLLLVEMWEYDPVAQTIVGKDIQIKCTGLSMIQDSKKAIE